jgi:hypothetical protein
VTEPTHASLAKFHLDPSREAEQLAGLRGMIVPGVREAPGFVTGCWTLDRDSNESVVLVTFDSQDHAETFATNVRENAPHQATVGIELISICVVEVTATA